MASEEYAPGRVLVSLRGRDAGTTAVVLAEEGDYVFIADGREHKAAAPKRKKKKHCASIGYTDADIARAVKEEQPVSAEMLRRAVRRAQAERGELPWQKRT